MKEAVLPQPWCYAHVNSYTCQKAGMQDKTLANIKQKQTCITPLFFTLLLLSGYIT